MTGVETSHVVVGVVSKLHDQTPGRLKVKFPHLGMCESDWCSVVAPMGGPGRGLVFLPEPGDQVVVALEHGDVNRGYVLGAVWTAKQAPPELDGKPAQNNLRLVRSRSGHQLRFDDTKGRERVEIVDKDGKRKVVIDTAGKKVQVICDAGDVEVTAGSGNVTVTAGSGSLKLTGKTVSVEASSTLEVKAGGAMTIKGATVAIN
jgi:uncharacterized protein involved in type VI secretion and phage assembly